LNGISDPNLGSNGGLDEFYFLNNGLILDFIEGGDYLF
jgi:hypothetical protein